MSVAAGSESRRPLWRQAHLVLPALLTGALAFRAGGFFAGVTGVAAVVLALAMVGRVTLAAEPFAGLSPGLVVAAGSLALFGVWILISSTWSHAPGRAVIEFDRALLYLLVLAFFGFFARRAGDLAAVLRWLALAIAVVAVAALATRLLPGQFPTSPGVSSERLAFPLTYWNALGILTVMGLVLMAHLASGTAERAPVRIAAAGAMPLMAVTVYFTFSRGAIGLGAIALLAYALLGASRGLPAALIATVPATGIALWRAYGSERLATVNFASSAARSQAEDLLVVLFVCVVVAMVLAALAIVLERRLLEPRSARPPARTTIALAGLLVVTAAAAAIVLDVPGRIGQQAEARVQEPGDLRKRLTTLADPIRIEHWRVARDAFEREPVHGSGAGTYRLLWERERTIDFLVNDGHSLYLEVLAELGLPGLLLVAPALLVPLGVALGRLWGPERRSHAAFLVAGGVLAVHTGIDWDWELPALFVGFFAAAGVILAAPAGAPGARAPGRLSRIVAALACLLLAVTPALVALNQASLNRSARAFKAGDCRTAIGGALDSLDVLSVRAEPFEILGYCDARAGQFQLALRAMQAARRQDPGNWQFAYGEAVMRGLNGLDPRPAAALARRLNPREALARELARAVRSGRPDRWRRGAARARIPFQ